MLGQDALDDRHLAVQEGDLAQAALDGDLLIQRELLATGKPTLALVARLYPGFLHELSIDPRVLTGRCGPRPRSAIDGSVIGVSPHPGHRLG